MRLARRTSFLPGSSTCSQQQQVSIRCSCASLQNSNVGGYNSKGFVEVLAASQSTVSKQWFQGTADAVRQYLWLFEDAERGGVEDLLILSGGAGLRHICPTGAAHHVMPASEQVLGRRGKSFITTSLY